MGRPRGQVADVLTALGTVPHGEWHPHLSLPSLHTVMFLPVYLGRTRGLGEVELFVLLGPGKETLE